jgi:uncharacterized protein (TIGR00251 family)
VRLELKVSPKASRNAITGFLGEVLKVSVTAAPERGKANAAVEELLAGQLGLPRKAVRVVAGETSKTKKVEIAGLEPGVLRERLRTILEQATRPGR